MGKTYCIYFHTPLPIRLFVSLHHLPDTVFVSHLLPPQSPPAPIHHRTFKKECHCTPIDQCHVQRSRLLLRPPPLHIPRFRSLGNPPTFLQQLNQNPCLLQKLKLAFVNGLDGVAAVAVKCHLPPPVTVVSLRAPATFSRCLRPPVSPRLGKEVNRQRLQIRCHRRSCLMLHNPSKEPVCPMAQSSSVISARPRSLPTSSNRTFPPLPLPLTLLYDLSRLLGSSSLAPRSHCLLLAPLGRRPASSSAQI